MTKILISAGGTGGGAYPALAVASALRRLSPETELHFATSRTGMENNLVANAGIALEGRYRIHAGPLHGVNIVRIVSSSFRLLVGLLQSLGLMIRLRPGAVFLTGGWVGFPVAFAAWLFRVPIIIFVPDIEPGRTLKLLGRFAREITATVEDTARYYPDHKTVTATGYPLRPGLSSAIREAGLAHFDLAADRRTLLVFGGSLGSRAINRAVYQRASELLARPDLQILHISGQLDAEEVQAAHATMPPELRSRYRVRDYVHQMGLALAVADLVVSRAGAATLSEYPLFGLPSILIPLAYSWRYQEVNADWLVTRGAAIRLDEERLEAELVPLILDLFAQDDRRLRAMRDSAQGLARTDGADNVARVILNQTKE